MSDNQSKCKLCGNPMPEGEEMFHYHGYSSPCPPKVGESRRDQLAKKYAEGTGDHYDRMSHKHAFQAGWDANSSEVLTPAQIDKAVCDWTMESGISLTEEQLNALVDKICALTEAFQ